LNFLITMRLFGGYVGIGATSLSIYRVSIKTVDQG
jgi:hypothetical protein